MNRPCRSAVQPSQRARTGTGVKAGTDGLSAFGDEAAGIVILEHKRNKNARLRLLIKQHGEDDALDFFKRLDMRLFEEAPKPKKPLKATAA